MRFHTSPLKGRGTSENPHNRFEALSYIPDSEYQEYEEDLPTAHTIVFRDPSRSILTRNTSPDIGFNVSVNPYRGCEHGCVYCYARPTHEWLGFSAGLDFETRLLAKQDAPQLLAKALTCPSYQPEPLVMSGITDPYQPIERQLHVTRDCLAVLADFRHPVAIITKNILVARDCDLLQQLAEFRASAVFISITTLDSELARRLEPRASTPTRRLAAIRSLAESNIPVGVMTAPIIPGLNDHEIPAILDAAAQAGAQSAGHTIVRLPYAVSELFSQWLEEHYPERKKKVLNNICAIRGGELNDARWHSRMCGAGIQAEAIHNLFRLGCRKAGLSAPASRLSTDAFRRPDRTGQLALFNV